MSKGFVGDNLNEPAWSTVPPDDRLMHHDYWPEWDYELTEIPDPDLAKLAIGVASRISQTTKINFELWFASLGGLAVGTYIAGTTSHPVILIDLEAHREFQDQLGKTISHELKHALQERQGLDFNEEDAENAC